MHERETTNLRSRRRPTRSHSYSTAARAPTLALSRQQGKAGATCRPGGLDRMQMMRRVYFVEHLTNTLGSLVLRWETMCRSCRDVVAVVCCLQTPVPPFSCSSQTTKPPSLVTSFVQEKNDTMRTGTYNLTDAIDIRATAARHGSWQGRVPPKQRFPSFALAHVPPHRLSTNVFDPLIAAHLLCSQLRCLRRLRCLGWRCSSCRCTWPLGQRFECEEYSGVGDSKRHRNRGVGSTVK